MCVACPAGQLSHWGRHLPSTTHQAAVLVAYGLWLVAAAHGSSLQPSFQHCWGSILLPRMQVSTVLGAALEEQRKEGEWIEGIAIWVAVAIVIMVGE